MPNQITMSRELKMVDLHGQYLRIKTEVDAAVAEVLNAAQYVKGPQVKTFEENLAAYLGVKHVLACANGTDALQIALMALDLQLGDEVITPSHTYVATAEAAALLKLKPVFVEVDAKSFTIRPEEIEKAITAKTKAIIPVHLYGQCADMEPIMKIAREKNIYVIEDNAQAIGADYFFSNGEKKKAGTIAHIGTTSFYPSKNLGAYGDAGAIFTNDDALAKKVKMIANHGQSATYIHDLIGVNSRLDTLQAAILNVKLKYLNEYAQARIAVADFYDKAFADLKNAEIPFRAKNSTHVFHQYTLRLKNINRDEVKKKLQEKGIPSMIYYPVPIHQQKAFQSFYDGKIDLSLTEELSKSLISLPVHTEFTKEDLQFVTETFISIVNNQ